MRPYGAQQEYQLQDRKRRYLNGRMGHEDRRDKRAARVAGKREAATQMAEIAEDAR